MIESVSIAAIIIAVATSIGTLLGALHLRKSSCLGSECICETEEKKIERIKSVIKSTITPPQSPIILEQKEENI